MAFTTTTRGRGSGGVHRGLAAAGLALVLAFVFAAIGSTGGVRSASSEPRRLIAVLEEDPPYINPALGTVISNFEVGSAIYQGLVKVDAEFNVSPDLAETWTVSDDKLTYTFNLRPNVKWHDGTPFTSADIKWSVENFNSKLHPYGRPTFKYLDTVTTPDANTVVYKLKQPYQPFLTSLEGMLAAIVPKHLFDTGHTDLATHPANKTPIGTGPFKFKEWVPGNHITLVRNPDYQGPGQPSFEEIVFRIMPDAPSRLTAYEAGEVDAIYFFAFPFSAAKQYETRPDTKVTWTTQRGGLFAGQFNVREGHITADKAVRKAIAHAIDRKFIRENINVGSAIDPYQVGPVPPVHPLYDKELADYAFDAAMANKLLDDAGHARGADGNRFELNVYTISANPGLVSMGQVIQQNLAPVGIKVNLNSLERAALNQAAYTAGQFDLVLESYGLGPDPAIGVQRFYDSRNIREPMVLGTNTAGYRNPAVDALFDRADSALTLEERKTIYKEAQAIIWDDISMLPLLAYLGPNVTRASVVEGLFDIPNSTWPNWVGARAVGAGGTPAASTGLSTVAIVAAVVAVLVIAALAWLLLRRRRRPLED